MIYDKTELNSFVQSLYDQKMQEGNHGHYETMFHVVHQAIKRVAGQPPVAWRYVTNGTHTLFSEVEPPDDAYDEGTLVPLYASPAPDKLPLTEQEIEAIACETDKEWYGRQTDVMWVRDFARAIEAAIAKQPTEPPKDQT